MALRGGKSGRLRELINGSGTAFLMEAHSGLSAKIVEEAGFQGIWASGLALSAAFGVRDNNEVSWTQIVDMVEFMNDRVSIPILLDGDTGYGNFNTVRRLVRKLEQRGIAGVCIEDKLFPKTNSFVGSVQQPLATVEEFCGKIKAAKDTQIDNDFVVVARTEAFIAGWGLDEALNRARAYAAAGADAVFVHSRHCAADDIFTFLKHWDHCRPVIIAPTACPAVPTKDFEQAGIAVIIWANQTLRASIAAMQKVARQLVQTRSARTVAESMVPMAEVFRLQDVEEYGHAEQRYLPQTVDFQAVILAASRGLEFGSLTRDRPKCMLEINGKSILARQVETLNRVGIKEITVVVGHGKETVTLPNLHLVENQDHASGGILLSYLLALRSVDKPCLLSFGDILYEAHILRDLLAQKGDIVLAVDTSWCHGHKPSREIDAVIGEKAPADDYLRDRCVPIKTMGVNIPHGKAHGEWIGLMKLTEQGVSKFASMLETFHNEEPDVFTTTGIAGFFRRLVQGGVEVRALYVRGHWLDIDTPADLSFGAGGMECSGLLK